MFLAILLNRFTFLFVCLFGYLYYRWRKRMSYFVGKPIPFVGPKPFLKENKWVVKPTFFYDEHEDIYKTFRGAKFGGYFDLYTPFIMICDPELIMKILTTDFASFNDHGLAMDTESDFLDDNMFFQHGPKWKALRRKLSPTFTSGRLKNMTPLIDDCTKNLLMYLSEHWKSGIELRDMFCRYTLDVIGSCAFGLDAQCLKDTQSKFKDVVSGIFNFSFVKNLRIIAKFSENKFFNRITVSREEVEAQRFFKGILTQTFQHRKKTKTTRNDFVDLLLQLKEKGEIETDAFDDEEIRNESFGSESIENVKLEITDEILTAQAFLFLIAGHETTATTLAFLTYLLAKNPKCQEKAREDVRKGIARHGGINYTSVKSMNYLEGCILESLRLYPPLVALPRKCTKEYTMDNGFVIEKGINVIIPIMSIHRDANYFPDPDVFDPERFTEGDKILPGTFLPFGGGPRICAGKRFAILEMLVTMAHLLNHYEILPNPQMTEPLEIHSNYILIKNVKGGLWANLKKLEG